MYTHHRNPNGTISGRIWIAKNVDWTIESLSSVLIHEMVHHWIWQTYGHDSGIKGHGWKFMRKCRELNKNYGLKIKRVNAEIYRKNEKVPATHLGRLLRHIRKWINL